MEGVERRLTEKHDDIAPIDSSKQREQTAVADISGIETNLTPPRDLIQVLDGSLPGALCGQKYQLTWESGPWRGLPVTGYCCEPLCINEGVCTGTRFVPHVDQYTTTETSFRQRRKMSKAEVVAAVRQFAHKAAAETGRDEDRTDRQILDLVKLVWTKTITHIRSQDGEWRR
jgi:hypothetical protein